MTVKGTGLGGDNITYHSITVVADLNDSINNIGNNVGGLNATFMIPVGGVIGWCKTFGTADSGTTSSASASKLIEAGQNFLTTVAVGMQIKNTTDNTYSYVVTVDSDTQLTIANDIMGSGENYTIYKTRALPSNYVECNGQVLSDADSIYNGETIIDLNDITTSKFLRGNTSSGGTGGSTTHTHSVTAISPRGQFSDSYAPPATTGATASIPTFITVCWIMRVK